MGMIKSMDDLDIRRLDKFARQKRLAWILGLGGLVPFIACAMVILVLGPQNPLTSPAVEIFRTYSVVILSFLGGIRWGHALLRVEDDITDPEAIVLVFSVIPSLVAWGTLFLNPTLAVGVLLVAFCAQGAWDSLSSNADKLPKWFAPLRMLLTLVVAAAHIIVFLRLVQG